MKLKRSSNITIAKSIISTANTNLSPLDYQKWKDFVECRSNYFIWNENTTEGKKTLEKINKFNKRLKARVLSTLNKGICFSEFNSTTSKYNISVTFYKELNWITIQFSRIPKLEDLKIFVEMAKHLDALLLVEGSHIIGEEYLANNIK